MAQVGIPLVLEDYGWPIVQENPAVNIRKVWGIEF